MHSRFRTTSILKKSFVYGALVIVSLAMTQCAKPRAITNQHGVPVATAQGNVTTQRLGDAIVMTRRLIHHPLTNADCGKVYEEVTIVSPRGTSVQQRVIVHAQPYLEVENITKR